MARRISRSVLDPMILPLVPGLYRRLSIPRRFPPEGIIGIGHACAVLGAVGFAYSGAAWWGAALGAIGVAGNHIADMVDGTHARQTGQCRNGGELLDHFTDPLSFSYWMLGLGIAAGDVAYGIPAMLVIMAMAVLTNIRAKITGEFTLSRFGPTEFKALLVTYGLTLSALHVFAADVVFGVPFRTIMALNVLGVVVLITSVYRAVRSVNRSGEAPDTSEWETSASVSDTPAEKT